MEQIVVRVQDENKAGLLLTLLRSLDFVDSVEAEINGQPVDDQESTLQSETNPNRHEQFMALAGIWAHRDVSIDSIREKAWPRQTP